MTSQESISVRIRRLRLQLGLTQGQLGERLGVTLVTVSRWETGQVCPNKLAMKALTALESSSHGQTYSTSTPSASVIRESQAVYGNSAPLSLPDFRAESEVVRLFVEGERLRYGHLFSPSFGIETAMIDPVPHQIIAVYKKLLSQPRLRFLLVSFEWGLADNYTDETTAVSMNTIGTFSFELAGLSANETYHFRAKAVGDGTAYGSDQTFTTLTPEPPPPFLRKWGTLGFGDGQFYEPRGVAVDASGNVYVADTSNRRIQKFTSSGAFITKWGSYGSGDGQFNSPLGVAVDTAGNVYVADYSNNRIQKFTSSPREPLSPGGALMAQVMDSSGAHMA